MLRPSTYSPAGFTAAQPRDSRHVDFRMIATDSLVYWEKMRPFYNAVLSLVFAGVFVTGLPRTLTGIGAGLVVELFVLAVLANVAYCAAYLPDVFAQASAKRDVWRRRRWMLFTLGCWFAGVITVPVATVVLRFG